MIPLPLVSHDDAQPNRRGFAQIIHNNQTGQKSLHSQQFFDAGDVICSFNAAAVRTVPDYLTLQIGINKHIFLKPDYLQYVNHSCDPSVFFDTTSMGLIAIKSIQPGDEFTFFYPSTEWKMAQSFECYCHSPRCLHQIRGAAFLSEADIARYRFTDFIKQQLKAGED